MDISKFHYKRPIEACCTQNRNQEECKNELTNQNTEPIKKPPSEPNGGSVLSKSSLPIKIPDLSKQSSINSGELVMETPSINVKDLTLQSIKREMDMSNEKESMQDTSLKADSGFGMVMRMPTIKRMERENDTFESGKLAKGLFSTDKR